MKYFLAFALMSCAGCKTKTVKADEYFKHCRETTDGLIVCPAEKKKGAQ